MSADHELLSVVETVDRHLDEAEHLLYEDHPEMAVVRAAGAFELFMKRAFVEPYLRARVFHGDGELGDLFTDALLGPSSWRGRLPKLLKAVWLIDVAHIPAWAGLAEAWQLRNQIVHHGQSANAALADRHVRSCRTVITALLQARELATETRKAMAELEADPAQSV